MDLVAVAAADLELGFILQREQELAVGLRLALRGLGRDQAAEEGVEVAVAVLVVVVIFAEDFKFWTD